MYLIFFQIININTTSHIMKSVVLGQQLNEFHQKCVCQICSCSKHKCPHTQIHIPHNQISTYQKEFVKHPINTWKKPPPQKAQPYQSYSYINSAYREHFPGQKPKMRQKIVPRVKDQNKSIPFSSTSEYFNEFGPKKVVKENLYIKDMQYNPDNQPFNGYTTYSSFFNKKATNPHNKRQSVQVTYPEGYKFNGSTIYGDSFQQKTINPQKSYKPIQKIAEKGPHDLNTIYRTDYQQKPQPEICPVQKLPKLPTVISHPSQHLTYNKFSGSWAEK